MMFTELLLISYATYVTFTYCFHDMGDLKPINTLGDCKAVFIEKLYPF